MGHKHSKPEILAGALEVALDEGFSNLSFGRVARHLAISDRVVVYYFPTKEDLVGETLMAMGGDLQRALEDAFTAPATDAISLARAAWPVLTAPENEAIFALFFEANGLAAAGGEPYRTLVPQLVEAWVSWAAELIDLPGDARRAEAEAAIALIDGLLLLRQMVGAPAGDRAAARFGVS